MDLIDPKFIRGLAQARTYGVIKYIDPNSWQPIGPDRYIAALYRHINAYHIALSDNSIKGQFDDESRLLHLDHAGVCLMFLRHFIVSDPSIAEQILINEHIHKII